MANTSKKIVLLILCLVIASLSFAVDRRKPQFLSESSYLIVPLPYSIPGIGEGLMFTALAGNIMGSYADAYILGITGDAAGTIMALQDIHLISETLIIESQVMRLDKAVVQQFKNRGMDTEKDDFQFVELSKVNNNQAKIMLSLFDRRVELSFQYFQQAVAIPRMLDAEGNVVTDFNPVYESESTNYEGKLILDYTDDRQDPLKGVRLDLARITTPEGDEGDPVFYLDNISLSAYLPIGKSSTLALNYYTSDAVVTKKGDTDQNVVLAKLGLKCGSYALCDDYEKGLIDSFVAGNTNGSSNSLGGDTRLRAYPSGRFAGAHTLYYSAEFRWNFATEVTPFDFWIWKDVATGFQLALFHEVGSVSELAKDIGEKTRTSSGVGFRMVSASGFVYRLDYASGDEGGAPTMMFGYAW
ncbi:MAG: hypothetical protein GY786_11425 [Proteobacteria bacterium]|nr:hypothetical protein [Pseudomonadota bacterium]